MIGSLVQKNSLTYQILTNNTGKTKSPAVCYDVKGRMSLLEGAKSFSSSLLEHLLKICNISDLCVACKTCILTEWRRRTFCHWIMFCFRLFSDSQMDQTVELLKPSAFDHIPTGNASRVCSFMTFSGRSAVVSSKRTECRAVLLSHRQWRKNTCEIQIKCY